MTAVPIDTTISSTLTYYSALQRLGVRDHSRGERYVETDLTKAGARTLRDELDKYVGDRPKASPAGDVNRYVYPVKPKTLNIDERVNIYGNEAVVYSIIHDGLTDTTTVKLYAVTPPKPKVPVLKVGDVINGDTLRAVQWKRGTVVRFDLPDGGQSTRFVLHADGHWINLNTGRTREFGDFGRYLSSTVYTVEHAPGKAA